MSVLNPLVSNEPPLVQSRRPTGVVVGALGLGRTRIGLGLVVIIAAIAIFGPLIAPHGPADFIGLPNAGPSGAARFGTDHLGQDVLHAQQDVFGAVQLLLGVDEVGQALAGKRAKRALSAGQVLIGQDLESASAMDPILVKQQGLVKLVARLGPIQVVADCEALQDGHKGQLIRVRNIDSRNIVVGRVVDRSLVEAEY